MAALGVDVGGPRKGFDLVLLGADRAVLAFERRVSAGGLAGFIEARRPEVIAIDSPPGWAAGGERRTETFVRSLGLQLFQTPWLEEKKSHPFYGWMVNGFHAFATAAAQGYPLFRGGSPRGHALEVFPYAVAVVVSGSLRPPELRMAAWRRRVLADQGVEVARLRGPDQVDAALAALTGLLALEGRCSYRGDAAEGVIVLPCPETELPATYAAPRRV